MFSQVKSYPVPDNSDVYFDPSRVFAFATEEEAKQFTESFTTQVVLKKKPLGPSLGQALAQKATEKHTVVQKRFKPVARKSALDVKVETELAQFQSVAALEAEIEAIEA